MSQPPDKIIYSMYRLTKNRNRKTILKNISLSYFYGAKIGVIGLNGSGKSTLLRIMAGVDTEFDGDVTPVKGYSIGFLEQEPLVDVNKTVEDVVREGVQDIVSLLDEFNAISAKFAEPMEDDEMQNLLDKQAEIQEKLDASDAWELESKMQMAMDALRCPPGNVNVNVLSGGEKRRVALCRLLLSNPDILLLDEPTNHLDAETVAWLEHFLQKYAGTVIAVTHDRYFLDNIAGWILELDRGEGVPWKGNYSSWLDQKEKHMANEEKEETQRRKTLQRELEWIRMTPKARHTKSKARIKSYENLLRQDQKEKVKDLVLYIPPGPRLGNICIQAENLSKSYDSKLLFENLSFALPSGGVVGVIGPNGAGKTTLFKLLNGLEQPDSGKITIGETVKLTYIDQSRDALDDTKTVWETISEGNDLLTLGTVEVNSRAYCAKFNFQGADQQKKLGELSGGERNRVHLAQALKEGGNVILLDEPTNDLDVNTLRALEEGIENFAGCAVIISHDRYFLDRVATHILAFEGDSCAVWFDGNFTEYELDRKRRLGSDSIIPKRIRYRQLTR